MAKPYKHYEPEQSLLFPPNIKDWLPESHLAYFVSDVVDQLDLSQIEGRYDKDFRGQPPFNPGPRETPARAGSRGGYCMGRTSMPTSRLELTWNRRTSPQRQTSSNWPAPSARSRQLRTTTWLPPMQVGRTSAERLAPSRRQSTGDSKTFNGFLQIPRLSNCVTTRV